MARITRIRKPQMAQITQMPNQEDVFPRVPFIRAIRVICGQKIRVIGERSWQEEVAA